LIHTNVDILENEIREAYPGVLEKLLVDHTTKQPIYWATDNYVELGEQYGFMSPIKEELITGKNGNVIMPRVQKDKELQRARARDMAEVFTPSWICNAQNNLIDDAWFGKRNVFNTEVTLPVGTRDWKVKKAAITFPKEKTWKDYVKDVRLEMACGEAPYVTSRYDTTTGEFIPIERRIGILDRKLRVVNENTSTTKEWLDAARIAYKSTYAFEWQGDNLLLAREAMLYTFIENYRLKFDKSPALKSIEWIAYIISWNVWQMDGLKGVLPNSCTTKPSNVMSLWPEFREKRIQCPGCMKDELHRHNGTYAIIKDWTKKDPETKRLGKKLKFVDVLKNQPR